MYTIYEQYTLTEENNAAKKRIERGKNGDLKFHKQPRKVTTHKGYIILLYMYII